MSQITVEQISAKINEAYTEGFKLFTEGKTTAINTIVPLPNNVTICIIGNGNKFARSVIKDGVVLYAVCSTIDTDDHDPAVMNRVIAIAIEHINA